MKRTLALIALCLCLLLCFSLVACKKSNDGSTDDTNTSGDTSTNGGGSTDGSDTNTNTNGGGSGNGSDTNTSEGGGSNGSNEGEGDSTNTGTSTNTDTSSGSNSGSNPGQGSGDGNGSGDVPSHTHVFGNWETKTEPSCSQAGVAIRECECGESETKPIQTTEHTEIPVQGYAPTCDTPGLTDGTKCKVCNEPIVEQQTIPAQHQPEVIPGTPANCYNTGLSAGSKCSACGDILEEQIVLDITHSVKELPAVEPDCYNTGLTAGRECEICGHPILPQQEIPKKHEVEVFEGYNPPDCFSIGYKDGLSCTLCGEVIQEREEIPAGHLDFTLIPGRIATCTEEGLTNGYECKVCNTVLVEQTVIEMSLHNFVDGNCTHCSITEFSQGLAYTLSDDGTYYTVSGRGTCKDLKIIIPETYLDKPVKKIGNSAFNNDKNILSVVIPSTIEEIGSQGFTYAQRLVEVYNLSPHINIVYTSNDQIGLYGKVIHTKLDEESVLKQEGDFIFAEINTPKIIAYTGNDAKVVLPDKYKGESYEIYQYAFCDYTKMVSIVVPQGSVTKIGANAFSSNSRLVEVYYMAGMQLEYNGSWQQGDLGKYAITIHKSLEVPSIVDIVGDYAFVTVDNTHYLVAYLGNETDITLPDDYKGERYSIYKNTFSDTSIENVTIPGMVDSIGASAFYFCKNLKNVYLNEGLKSIGDYAFFESSLRELIIPDGIESVGNAIFAQCPNLAHVVLGEGVTKIDGSMFTGCINLVSITLPSTLTSIDASAFVGTNSNGLLRLKEIINHSSLNIKVGDTTQNGYIAKNATVVYTDSDAESTLFVENDCVFIVVDGVYYFVAYVGSNSHVVLPSGVNGGNKYVIATKALRGVSLVKSIVISSGVSAIDEYAFYSSSLTSVTFESGVESIGKYAFSYSPITSITLPEGLKTISPNAFSSCSKLTTVVLPKSLKALGKDCFKSCSALASVTFLSPNNWYSTPTEGATSGNDLSPRTDTASIANSLKSGSYYWYKK